MKTLKAGIAKGAHRATGSKRRRGGRPSLLRDVEYGDENNGEMDREKADQAVAALLYASAWNRRYRNSRRSGGSSLVTPTIKRTSETLDHHGGYPNQYLVHPGSSVPIPPPVRRPRTTSSQRHLRANAVYLKSLLDILQRTSLTEMRDTEMMAWLEQTALWLSNEEARQSSFRGTSNGIPSNLLSSSSTASYLDVGYGGSYFPYLQVDADEAANVALLGKVYFRIVTVLQTLPWWRQVDISLKKSTPEVILRVLGYKVPDVEKSIKPLPEPLPLSSSDYMVSQDSRIDNIYMNTLNSTTNHIPSYTSAPPYGSAYNGWFHEATSLSSSLCESSDLMSLFSSASVQVRREALQRSQYAVQLAFERLCLVCISHSAHCAHGAVEALMRPFSVCAPSGRDGVQRLIPADSMLRVLNRFAKDQKLLEQQQQQQSSNHQPPYGSDPPGLSYSFSFSSAPPSSTATLLLSRKGSLVKDIFTQGIRHWMPKLKWPDVWHHVASTAIWLHLALEDTIPLREDEEEEEEEEEEEGNVESESGSVDGDPSDGERGSDSTESESDTEEGMEGVDEKGHRAKRSDPRKGRAERQGEGVEEGEGEGTKDLPINTFLSNPSLVLPFGNNAISLDEALQGLADLFRFEQPPSYCCTPPTVDESAAGVIRRTETIDNPAELSNYHKRCLRNLQSNLTKMDHRRVNYGKIYGSLILELLLERFLMMELALEPNTLALEPTSALENSAVTTASQMDEDMSYFFSPPTSPTSIMSPSNFAISDNGGTRAGKATTSTSSLTKCAVVFPLSARLLRTTSNNLNSSPSSPNIPSSQSTPTCRSSCGRRNSHRDDNIVENADTAPNRSMTPSIPPAMASLFAYPTCIPLQSLHQFLWSRPLEDSTSAVPIALRALYTHSTGTTIDCLEPCVALLYSRLRQDMLLIIVEFERRHSMQSEEEVDKWRISNLNRQSRNSTTDDNTVKPTPALLRSPSLSPSSTTLRASAPSFPSWWSYLVVFHFTVLRQVGGPMCLAYLLPSLLQVYATRVDHWIQEKRPVSTTLGSQCSEKGDDGEEEDEEEKEEGENAVLHRLRAHQSIRQTLQQEEALNIMHRLISLVLRGYYLPTPAMLRTGSHSPALASASSGNTVPGSTGGTATTTATTATTATTGPTPIRMASIPAARGASIVGEAAMVTVPMTDRIKLAHYLYPLFKFFHLHHWHRVQDEQRRGLTNPDTFGGASAATSTRTSIGAGVGGGGSITKTAAEVLLRRLVKWCRVHVPQETKKGSSTGNGTGAESAPPPHPLSSFCPPTASAILTGIVWAQTMAIASSMDAAVSLSSQQQQRQQQQQQLLREELKKRQSVVLDHQPMEVNLKRKREEMSEEAMDNNNNNNNNDNNNNKNKHAEEKESEEEGAPPYWTMMGALWTDPALSPLMRYYQPSSTVSGSNTTIHSTTNGADSNNSTTTMWLDFCRMEEDGLIRLTLLECCPWPVSNLSAVSGYTP